MPDHGVYCGDIGVSRYVLLQRIPDYETGVLVRAVNVTAVPGSYGSTQDYWRLAFGTMKGGRFTPKFNVALTGPAPSGIARYPCSPPWRINRGEMAAMSFERYGYPASLEGLSVLLETGSLGQR